MAARRKKRLPRVNLRRLERSHGARIRQLVDPLREIMEKKLFPLLDSYVGEIRSREDDEIDLMSNVFNNIRVTFAARFSDTLMNREIERSAEQINSAGADVHRRQLRTVLGVDPVQAEPWLQTEVNAFVKENASLIKSIPEEHISDIEQLVFREGRRRSSPGEIRQKILEQFQVAESRAELIARDQVTKFNGRLTELRQKQSGIKHYFWRDSDDGRVRTLANTSGYSDHASLDGKRFSWDKPPVTVFKGKRAGERHHPGEDIQCRCFAEPDLSDLIPGI